MRRGLLLVALFLVMKLRLCQSGCEEPGSRRSSSGEIPGLGEMKRNLLKRYSDVDYDSFVGLMGRRNADTNGVQSQQKREMHDIFVGLMGRRNSEPGNAGPWRKANPETKGIFYNKCRLRFRRGL
ncbi:tachykinin-3a [Osmerus eperlanus]|uniref:tachykinin-3a n=1 Tax=Osmerus eperlanus TaxID=29151 RepID=UPI002E1303E4